jgi:hypothetical protein
MVWEQNTARGAIAATPRRIVSAMLEPPCGAITFLIFKALSGPLPTKSVLPQLSRLENLSGALTWLSEGIECHPVAVESASRSPVA